MSVMPMMAYSGCEERHSSHCDRFGKKGLGRSFESVEEQVGQGPVGRPRGMVRIMGGLGAYSFGMRTDVECLTFVACDSTTALKNCPCRVLGRGPGDSLERHSRLMKQYLIEDQLKIINLLRS